MMIHTVYFWLKDGLGDGEIAVFEEALRKLLEIDVIKRGHVGVPAATPERPVTDHSFGYSLHLLFDSVEEHNTYQDHLGHHTFVNQCRDFWVRAAVYDSELLV